MDRFLISLNISFEPCQIWIFLQAKIRYILFYEMTGYSNYPNGLKLGKPIQPGKHIVCEWLIQQNIVKSIVSTAFESSQQRWMFEATAFLLVMQWYFKACYKIMQGQPQQNCIIKRNNIISHLAAFSHSSWHWFYMEKFLGLILRYHIGVQDIILNFGGQHYSVDNDVYGISNLSFCRKQCYA